MLSVKNLDLKIWVQIMFIFPVVMFICFSASLSVVFFVWNNVHISFLHSFI